MKHIIRKSEINNDIFHLIKSDDEHLIFQRKEGPDVVMIKITEKSCAGRELFYFLKTKELTDMFEEFAKLPIAK
jgi:hypothetical protein